MQTEKSLHNTDPSKTLLTNSSESYIMKGIMEDMSWSSEITVISNLNQT